MAMRFYEMENLLLRADFESLDADVYRGGGKWEPYAMFSSILRNGIAIGDDEAKEMMARIDGETKPSDSDASDGD
jgi:hypothetical protein